MMRFNVKSWRYQLLSTLCVLAFVATFLVAHQASLSSATEPSTNLPGETELADLEPATLSIADGVQETVLENGLIVLTKEVQTMPAIALQVIYRVGSANESEDQEGLAHLLEHTMFRGTEARPVSFRQLFRSLGINNRNATTADDYTNYFSFITPNQLKAVLTLEADRMQNLRLDPQDIELEKQAVISEREGNENRPFYQQLVEILKQTLAHSPYSNIGTGDRDSMQRISAQDLRDLYHQYYRPQNAALVLVGSFETHTVLKDIKNIFGTIPATQQFEHRFEPVERPLFLPNDGITIQQKILAKPEIRAVYAAPNKIHPDRAALEVLAGILSWGKTGRLHQTLVQTNQASSASSFYWTYKDAGLFWLSAQPIQGISLDELNQELLAQISQIQSNGVSLEELERVRKQILVNRAFYQRRLTSQAATIARDWATTGDFRTFDRHTQNLLRITAEDVQRVAQDYLIPDFRATFYFEPSPTPDYTDEFSSSEPTEIRSDALSTTHSPTDIEPFDLEAIAPYLPALERERSPSIQPQNIDRFTLDNGINVLLVHDPTTPTAWMKAQLPGGSAFDPEGQAGLSDLTADNLTSGTTTMDEDTLALSLEANGIGYRFYAGFETIVASMSGLSTDLPQMVHTLRDVLENATFPEGPFERIRQQWLQGLQTDLKNPAYVARTTAQQTLYPDQHPKWSVITEESLNSIRREDVRDFYRTHYRPDALELVLVSDLDTSTVQAVLEEKLGDWQAALSGEALEAQDIPDITLPDESIRQNPVVPGASQVITYMKAPGIYRTDSRYYASDVLSEVLTIRFMTELRERLGLTYSTSGRFWSGLTSQGEFSAYIQTAPENTAIAIDRALNIIRDVQTHGISPDELDLAKRLIMSDYVLNMAHLGNFGAELLSNQLSGLPDDEVYTYSQTIDDLTLEAVNQAAAQLLHPDRLVMVSAGPNIPEF